MIDPIILDPCGSDERYAALATELLLKHRTNVIFGACLSTSRKAVLPVVERFNGILFYPSVYEGFEYSPNVIYGGAVPNQVVVPLLEYLLQNRGRRFVLLGTDTLYAREVNRIVTEFLVESDGEVISETYLPLGAKEDSFGVVLKSLSGSGAEAVISTVVGDDSVALYNAFSSCGLDGTRLPIASLTTTESELARIRPEARVGHISVTSYFSTVALPTNASFREEFLLRYGSDEAPGVYTEVCYSQVHLFANAVRQAGSTETEALLSTLSGAVLKGPAGDLFLDIETNHASLRPLIGEARQDGTFEIIWRGSNVIRPDPYLVSYDRSVTGRVAV